MVDERKAPIGAIDLCHMKLFHYTLKKKKSIYCQIEINVIINSFMLNFHIHLLLLTL